MKWNECDDVTSSLKLEGLCYKKWCKKKKQTKQMKDSKRYCQQARNFCLHWWPGKTVCLTEKVNNFYGLLICINGVKKQKSWGFWHFMITNENILSIYENLCGFNSLLCLFTIKWMPKYS